MRDGKIKAFQKQVIRTVVIEKEGITRGREKIVEGFHGGNTEKR